MSIKTKIALKREQAKLFYSELRKKTLKICFAVVVAEFIITGVVAVGLNYGALEWFKPKTVESFKPKTVEEQAKPESVQDIIKRVAEEESFDDIKLLLNIADCESGFDQYAENPNSTATGVFQYLEGTWTDGAKRMGKDWKLEDRYNTEKATRMTIYFIRSGHLKKWNASKHCWGIVGGLNKNN